MLEKLSKLEQDLMFLTDDIQQKLARLRGQGYAERYNPKSFVDSLNIDIEEDDSPELVGVTADGGSPYESEAQEELSSAADVYLVEPQAYKGSEDSISRVEEPLNTPDDFTLDLAAAAQVRLLQVEARRVTAQTRTRREEFGNDGRQQLGTRPTMQGPMYESKEYDDDYTAGEYESEQYQDAHGMSRMSREEYYSRPSRGSVSSKPSRQAAYSGEEVWEDDSGDWEEEEWDAEDGYSDEGALTPALDANLVTGIVRWVASAKRKLGSEQMVALLEIYKISGNLSPSIEKVIVKVANMPLPDESDIHQITAEDLVDLFMMLHGTIHSTVEASETAEWFDGQGEVLEDIVVSQAPAPPPTRVKRQTYPAPERPARREPITPRWEEATAPELGVVSAELDVEQPRPSAKPERRPNKPEKTETPQPLPEPSRFEPPRIEPERFRAERATSPEDALNRLIASISGIPQIRFEDVAEEALPDVQKLSVQRVRPAPVPEPEADDSDLNYPSDLTDREWRRVEALLPPPKAGGRPSKYERREIVNAILYALRTKCSWRMLPDDLPPWKIVHHYYSTWREDGSWEHIESSLGSERVESGRPDR